MVTKVKSQACDSYKPVLSTSNQYIQDPGQAVTMYCAFPEVTQPVTVLWSINRSTPDVIYYADFFDDTLSHSQPYPRFEGIAHGEFVDGGKRNHSLTLSNPTTGTYDCRVTTAGCRTFGLRSNSLILRSECGNFHSLEQSRS